MKSLGKYILDNEKFILYRVLARYNLDRSNYIQQKIKEDTRHNIQHLGHSILLKSPESFFTYALWLRDLLVKYNIEPDGIITNFDYIADAIEEDGVDVEAIRMINNEVRERINKTPFTKVSFLDDPKYGELGQTYLHKLRHSNRNDVYDYVVSLLSEGYSIKEVFLDVIQPVQYEVGQLWMYGDMTVAEEHYCSASSQMIMARLYPLVFEQRDYNGTVVATCVGNELHELGIRMIADILDLEGISTWYVGANTPLDSIVEMVIEKSADIVIVSATMLKNVSEVRKLIDKLHDHSLTSHVKIMVGGYPFNTDPNLYKQIGADGYSKDADDAYKVVMEYLHVE